MAAGKSWWTQGWAAQQAALQSEPHREFRRHLDYPLPHHLRAERKPGLQSREREDNRKSIAGLS